MRNSVIVAKSAWQQDTERQLAEMDYLIRAALEENDELRRMIGNLTLFLSRKPLPDISTNTT